MNLRNAVLVRAATDRPGLAHLNVDQTHPFFFDHPLDHVPGLLLLEGAVQAAQDCATAPCYVSAIRAEFLQYTLFGAPILVDAKTHERDGRQYCTVEITQADIPRARIDVELSRLVKPIRNAHPSRRGPERALTPCPGLPLNKERPENVLIMTPVITQTTVEARLLPMSADCLFSDTTQAVHPLYLLEAFMQVQRYLNATQDGDKRIRDILTGVSIEQILPIADLSNGVFLRGARDFAPTGRGRLSRSAWLYAGHKAFAKCAIQTARAARRVKPPQGDT